MISENSESGAGSEDTEESMNLCFTEGTPKGADTDEHKYKHKNLDAILPDPGNIIGLEDSQLARVKAKELNKILKEKPDLPADSKKKIKEVRRTLKNRGYARGSRHKKLEEERKLQAQCDKIKAETDLIAKETSKFKAKLQSLQDSCDYRIEWAESEGINIPDHLFPPPDNE